MNLGSIEAAVAYAEGRWLGLQFKIKTGEATSACPFCLDGVDRFHVFEDGGYWCRRCQKKGWLDEEAVQLSAEELHLRKIEAEQARQARKQRELEKRQQMARCTDHLTYHQALDDNDREWWHQQGISDASIDKYQLGICYGCPTDLDRRISMTIPVFDSTGSRLVNIRHRIIGADNGDKYRPHMAGLPPSLFNAHLVRTKQDLVLVEGEKKAIVVTQHGFPAVGISGKSGFNLAWLQHFQGVKRLWVVLDPDAQAQANALGLAIAEKAGHILVHVCDSVLKPDDFFLAGGDSALFARHLSYGKKVV